MKVLAIETSCDETAAAVVDASTRDVLGQAVYSQYKEHAPYGGVVPELASRAHLERLPALVTEALNQASVAEGYGPLTLSPSYLLTLNAVAATTGPGLTTALAIGSTFAKTMAVALGKPFVATNHIEAHALTPHLINPNLTFPYLLLLVSGGHCQLIQVENVGVYHLLGTTLDDAVGECFDKVGKLLNLPHPAGPAIEQLAKQGNPQAIALPMPKNDKSLDFSFAGLKTAVRDILAKGGTAPVTPTPADLAASFQHTVSTILTKKCRLAIEHLAQKGQKPSHLVAAGGVAANLTIRAGLQTMAEAQGVAFTAPPLSLCTDNAVMIAYTAGLRQLAGLPNEGLTARPRPRWPLDLTPNT